MISVRPTYPPRVDLERSCLAAESGMDHLGWSKVKKACLKPKSSSMMKKSWRRKERVLFPPSFLPTSFLPAFLPPSLPSFLPSFFPSFLPQYYPRREKVYVALTYSQMLRVVRWMKWFIRNCKMKNEWWEELFIAELEGIGRKLLNVARQEVLTEDGDLKLKLKTLWIFVDKDNLRRVKQWSPKEMTVRVQYPVVLH